MGDFTPSSDQIVGNSVGYSTTNKVDDVNTTFDQLDGLEDLSSFIEFAERVEEEFDKSECEPESDQDAYDATPIMVDFSNEFYRIEEYFYTVEAATDWIHRFGRQLGLVIIKLASYLDRKSPTVVYGCERRGKPNVPPEFNGAKVVKEDDETKGRGRKSYTKRDGCPFKLTLKHEPDGEFWYFVLNRGGHNHEPFISPFGHAFLGRLNPAEREYVEELTESNTKTAQILKLLRKKFLDNCTSAKTIYNLRAEMKKRAMEGRTVMQEIFKLAEKEDTIIRYTSDNKDRISNLFWSFEASNKIARSFPHLFIMDCTYKTNRYKLPLLHIVGVTSTDMTFCAGFALLSSEVQASYEWALRMFKESLRGTMPTCIITNKEMGLMNAITIVFPESKRLLCQWHISRVVASAAQTHVPKGDGHRDEVKKIMNKWLEIMSCRNDAHLNTVVEEAKTWMDPNLIEYMEKTWIKDFKDQFIAGWIDEVLHFGNTCTSRVEGMHGVLKGWLGTPNLDLVSHWNRITDMVAQQFKNIEEILEKSLSKRAKEYVGKYWTSEIDRRVSLKALRLIHGEMIRRQMVGTNVQRCGCFLRKTHGIPCAHELNLQFQSGSTCVRLDSIHSYWKTLSAAQPSPDCNDDDERLYLVIRNKLDERWAKLTGHAKKGFLDQLREVVSPTSTILREPPIKVNNRGRPKGAKNKKWEEDDESTKRDPSLFEIVQSQVTKLNSEALQKKSQTSAKKTQSSQNNSQEGVKKNVRKRKKIESEKTDVDVKPNTKRFVSMEGFNPNIGQKYYEQSPQFMAPYLKSVTDVEGDGNCGYRAIDVQLYLDQEKWSDVRNELWHELNDHFEDYSKLMMSKSEAEKVKRHLIWPKSMGGCRSIKWMDTPNARWVIAQKYNSAVSLLSCKNGGTITCLPYRTPPESDNPSTFGLCLLTVTIMCLLKLTVSVHYPPLQRGWNDNHKEAANRWKDLFENRLKIGTALLSVEDNRPKDPFVDLGE